PTTNHPSHRYSLNVRLPSQGVPAVTTSLREKRQNGHSRQTEVLGLRGLQACRHAPDRLGHSVRRSGEVEARKTLAAGSEGGTGVQGNAGLVEKIGGRVLAV